MAKKENKSPLGEFLKRCPKVKMDKEYSSWDDKLEPVKDTKNFKKRAQIIISLPISEN